jgi:hypothetical protein
LSRWVPAAEGRAGRRKKMGNVLNSIAMGGYDSTVCDVDLIDKIKIEIKQLPEILQEKCLEILGKLQDDSIMWPKFFDNLHFKFRQYKVDGKSVNFPFSFGSVDVIEGRIRGWEKCTDCVSRLRQYGTIIRYGQGEQFTFPFGIMVNEVWNAAEKWM